MTTSQSHNSTVGAGGGMHSTAALLGHLVGAPRDVDGFVAVLSATCNHPIGRRQRRAVAEQGALLADIGVMRHAGRRREAASPLWDIAKLDESCRSRANRGAWMTLTGLIILLVLLQLFAPALN